MERSRIYGAFERVSRKWWFYVLVVMALGIPPYASTGVAPEQIASLVQEVLSQGLTAYSALMPMLHIAVAALVVLVGIYGNRVGRLFSAFMASLYIHSHCAEHCRNSYFRICRYQQQCPFVHGNRDNVVVGCSDREDRLHAARAASVVDVLGSASGSLGVLGT